MKRIFSLLVLFGLLSGCAVPPNAPDGSNAVNSTQAAYGTQSNDPTLLRPGVGLGIGIGSWSGRGGVGAGIGYGW
jgi:hypothetical protein